MSLFSIVIALLLEQARPLSGARVDSWLGAYGRQLDAWFNAGELRHGRVAWGVGVGLPVLAVFVLQLLLGHFAPILSLLLNVGVLYLTVGFRQYSHYFTDIHLALRLGELDRARQLLGAWRGTSAERLSSGELARLAIEQALIDSHRRVFGPLLLFVLLGPAGALLHRLAMTMARQWENDFGACARQAWEIVDWLPSRATAVAFAVVGDFEDAVYCWRTQAEGWRDRAEGILLASGAGALGVRLGMPLHTELGNDDRPTLGLGDDADADFMQSTVGLVWRTLVLGVLLLALIWVASWVG